MTTIAEYLATFPQEELARLLTARPDLLRASTLQDVARIATSTGSTYEAVRDLPWAPRQVLGAFSLLPDGATAADLVSLDPDADADGLVEAVDELEARLLLGPWHAGWKLIGPSRQYLDAPLGLGRSMVACLEHTSHYDLCEILALHGEPRPRSKDIGRHQLAEVMSDPEALHDVLLGLPEEVLALLRRADAEGPVIKAPGADPWSYGLPDDEVIRAAVAVGMMAVVGIGRVELPRELGLALRWPSVTRFDVRPPSPQAIPVTEDEVAATCGGHVQTLLDAVDELVRRIDARPVPLLTNGGIGVREVRLLAADLGEPALVSLLLRLLDELGLIASGRKTLVATKAWGGWSEAPEVARFTELVRAWLSTVALPAARPEGERKLKAALSWDFEQRAPLARHQVVRLLGESGPDAHALEGWLVLWHWRWPQQRLSADAARGHLADRELRADVLWEAEQLGLLAAGAASPLARALFRGADLAAALEGLTSAGEQRVRAQADMTLIATGRPSREMRQALDRIAKVEASGAATVWRISELSLGRAYDEGDAPDDVLAVLERYAGELPQSMAYLVKDAHRRYGRVVVSAATAVVVVDDDVQLQDALLKRGAAAKAAKALGLRRVAPGVAVSKGSIAATVAALQDLGLSAVADGTAAHRPPVKRVAAPARREVPALPVFDACSAAQAAVRRLLA